MSDLMEICKMSEETLKNSLVSIAAELYRLQSVFDKVTSKLDVNEQRKYLFLNTTHM